MAKQDYYELLGVAQTADASDIKSAYRKLAMEFHPDRNQGCTDSEQRFKEVSEAYEVLKDGERRAAYDRYGHAAFENGGAGGRGFDFGGNFADVFEDLFGEFMNAGRRQRSAAQRGADLRFNLEIDLAAAFAGKNETVEIPRAVACDQCDGSGAEAGTQPEVCPSCGGRGKIRSQQGFFMVERTCPGCRGAGRIIANPCNACDGAGRVREQKTLTVRIPPGVDDGTRIRLSGEGEAGVRGGPPGDLYIFVTIAPHPLFARENNNIFCRVPIPMTTAILGGEIEVPTIAGAKARVKVPAGTQTGKQFRLRGKGMPQINTSLIGDMIIEARIETPTNLSNDQKKLIKAFAGEDPDKWSPESGGFFDKVKELWSDKAE